MARYRVQVAVVAGLILALAGWLMPAVIKVREAAARATCQSNFKGLICGLHNYAEVNNQFPNGTIVLPGVPAETRLSWIVPTLPYISRENESARFDIGSPADHPVNLVAADTPIRHLICPSSAEYPDSFNDASTPRVTHIVAISGIGPDAATLPAAHSRAGLLGNDRGARIDPKFNDIPDGTCNTLMLAEVSSDVGPWARGGWGTLRDFDPPARPYIGRGRTFGGFHIAERNWFAPNHYGTNAAMADGSVRFISNMVTPEVLEALATKAGGESLPKDW